MGGQQQMSRMTSGVDTSSRRAVAGAATGTAAGYHRQQQARQSVTGRAGVCEYFVRELRVLCSVNTKGSGQIPNAPNLCGMCCYHTSKGISVQHVDSKFLQTASI